MTNLQRILLRRSEVRQKINELVSVEDPTTEQDAELGALETEYGALEVRERAAIIAEDANGSPPAPSEDGEGREIRELERRARLHNYFAEIAQDVVLTGAEAEYRQAVLGDNPPRGMLPLQMLLTESELADWQNRNAEPETRARTPVAAAAITEGNQMSIAGRVFARSVAGYFGIPMPTVPIGTSGYPYLSGGTTFSQQATGGEQLAVAGTFAGAELSPLRATASYEYAVEDMYKLSGLEEALRRDLREGLNNLLSEQHLSGDGSAPNVQGIRTAIAATPTTDPTDADDFAEITQRFGALVDGLNAYGLGDLRVLMSAGTYLHAITQYRGSATTMSAYDWVMERCGGVEVSSRFPVPASDISHSVVHKASYPERNAVAPVWQGLQLVDDPYSLAQSGQRRITAILLHNFRVLEANAWAHLKVHDA